MAKFYISSMNCSRTGKKKVNSFKNATQNAELILRARAINFKTIPYKFNQFDFALQQKYIHTYTTYRLVLYFLYCPLTCSNEMLISIRESMASKFKFHLHKTPKMRAEQSWMGCFLSFFSLRRRHESWRHYEILGKITNFEQKRMLSLPIPHWSGFEEWHISFVSKKSFFKHKKIH